MARTAQFLSGLGKKAPRAWGRRSIRVDQKSWDLTTSVAACDYGQKRWSYLVLVRLSPTWPSLNMSDHIGSCSHITVRYTRTYKLSATL